MNGNSEKSTFLRSFRKINLTFSDFCSILNIACVPVAQIGASVLKTEGGGAIPPW